jgi:PAS domain S-box-containing protein
VSELFGKREDKKEALKALIRKLHEGADPSEIKGRFKEVIKGVTPAEIAWIEEELIKEGLPREEVSRLCDVHLAVFRESLEKEKTLAPAGHPIHILLEEHKMLLRFVDELKAIAVEVAKAGDHSSAAQKVGQLNTIADHLRDSESHYLREENVLFPYLEKHGITQPPAIMWMEHDQIRAIKKNLYQIIGTREGMPFQDFADRLEEIAKSLAEALSNHIYKENNILFPTALEVVDEDEWKDIRKQFDELGYCCFTPEFARVPFMEALAVPPKSEVSEITFETGYLSKEEIEAILNTLPVDITFVDKDDTVKYFNQSERRIFVRTKAVIGRKVQRCHPPKSIHVVNQILDDFKSGRRDVAEFWINRDGKLVYIRYFPVRNKNGTYLGCIEVSQDITDIKKIEGEKRLL